MMATVPHVISGLGLRKFQADGFLLTGVYLVHAKWVPVTTLRHVLRLTIWRVATNIPNKQSQTSEKGWSSKWRVGWSG